MNRINLSRISAQNFNFGKHVWITSMHGEYQWTESSFSVGEERGFMRAVIGSLKTMKSGLTVKREAVVSGQITPSREGRMKTTQCRADYEAQQKSNSEARSPIASVQTLAFWGEMYHDTLHSHQTKSFFCRCE